MNAATPIPALSVRALRAGYPGGGDIVRGISVDLAPETILAVIGPNGSGKSSFVKTLAGLLRSREGSIEVTGKEVTNLSPARRVRAGLAYVPQEANVFRNLTIAENLKLAVEFLRGLGHDHAHRGAALPQAPDLIERLIGRNATADDQQHALGGRFG